MCIDKKEIPTNKHKMPHVPQNYHPPPIPNPKLAHFTDS